MAMNFRSSSGDEPEINLIPFIDVLLVILIFLMLTTTYSKLTELKIRLPQAEAERPADPPQPLIVGVSADGRVSVDGRPVADPGVAGIAAALEPLRRGSNGQDRVVIVSADALASHQSVVTVMDAARRAGIAQLSFATQRPAEAP